MWGSSFRDAVDLTNARIDRSVAMDEASFAETVYAGGLNVGRDLFMRRGAEFRGEIFLIGARVGALLELRYAKAWFVDLSWAEVTGLHTDGLRWWCEDGKPLNGIADHSLTLGKLGSQVPRCERSDGADLPKFILRNVHVGAFQDDPDAWPPSLDLEGFSYDRLGGIAGVSKLANSGRADMRKRSPHEWTDWLARDRIFSTQPYSQLSSVLAAAGHRDGAEAIQFVGRQRERGEARARGDLGSWAWLTLFSLVAGYGIGLYTFGSCGGSLDSSFWGPCAFRTRHMRAVRACSGGSALACIDYCRLSNSARSSRTSLTTRSPATQRNHAISTVGRRPILQGMPLPAGCSAYSCSPR